MVHKIVMNASQFYLKFWKITVILTLAGIVLIWFGLKYASTHESTDDAFIEGDVTVISPKVSGHIARVYVSDNQTVRAHQLLCEIDDQDYKNSLDLARAQLQSAQAEARQAKEDFERYKTLLASQDISQQQFDKALLRSNMASAGLSAAGARYNQAVLNLSYTKIMAPADGIIAQKDVEPGMFVQTGQALMAVVLPERWVIANMKETQMTRIYPGLKVTIKVDAYPGKTFYGHVDSIQPGTGSRFSLLPTENATGNFIKVVQRNPVKIIFDGESKGQEPLNLGMSVIPIIEITSSQKS